ncbi:hypothetical protein Hanom_Chr15g01337051 [Helianthus anomalus]
MSWMGGVWVGLCFAVGGSCLGLLGDFIFKPTHNVWSFEGRCIGVLGLVFVSGSDIYPGVIREDWLGDFFFRWPPYLLFTPMPKTWSTIFAKPVYPTLCSVCVGCWEVLGWDRFCWSTICKEAQTLSLIYFPRCKLVRMMPRVLGPLVVLYMWTKNWLHHPKFTKDLGMAYNCTALKLHQLLNEKPFKCIRCKLGMFYGTWFLNISGDNGMGLGMDLCKLLKVVHGSRLNLLYSGYGAGSFLLPKTAFGCLKLGKKGRDWAVLCHHQLHRWMLIWLYYWQKFGVVVYWFWAWSTIQVLAVKTYHMGPCDKAQYYVWIKVKRRLNKVFWPTYYVCHIGQWFLSWGCIEPKNYLCSYVIETARLPLIFGPKCIVYWHVYYVITNSVRSRFLYIPRVGFIISYFWSPKACFGRHSGGMPLWMM